MSKQRVVIIGEDVEAGLIPDDAAALDAARELGLNVSALTDTALRRAVAEARLNRAGPSPTAAR